MLYIKSENRNLGYLTFITALWYKTYFLSIMYKKYYYYFGLFERPQIPKTPLHA